MTDSECGQQIYLWMIRLNRKWYKNTSLDENIQPKIPKPNSSPLQCFIFEWKSIIFTVDVPKSLWLHCSWGRPPYCCVLYGVFPTFPTSWWSWWRYHPPLQGCQNNGFFVPYISLFLLSYITGVPLALTEMAGIETEFEYVFLDTSVWVSFRHLVTR